MMMKVLRLMATTMLGWWMMRVTMVSTCWPSPALALVGVLMLSSAYQSDDERGTHRCRLIESLVTLSRKPFR